MSLDMTSFDAALKEHYTDERIFNMVYADNPFFAMVAKDENAGGRNIPVPIIYGNPQGRSASFTRAQTRGQLLASGIEQFTLTRVNDYAVATIEGETLEASKGDSNAFMDAAITEIDGALNSLTRSCAIAQYGTGYGGIGQIGSISTTTITLLNIQDITNFEVGQELDLAASESSGTLRAKGSSTNGLIVTGVNRVTGVLTFGDNVTDATNGIPTAAANDYIFVRGDRQDTASPARIKLSGLGAWCPSSAPSSTSFFGVDRTIDSRLAGLRYTGTGYPIEEVLLDAAALAGREGGKPDKVFMSYQKWADLEKALGSKVQYVEYKMGEVGFKGIRINGPKGPIDAVPDQNAPANNAFMLQMNTWKLYSIGKVPKVINADGMQMLRQASADGVEIRFAYRAQLGCRAPGFNVNITL